VAIDYYSVGDLVKLSEDLFYRYDRDEAFRSAAAKSAYYAIGMKPWMVGVVIGVRTMEEYVIDPDVYMPHRFIYDVFWTGGIGLRREQHCDLLVISKV
tara:strand:+ start:728 stop:1021 length:294 start_codon:yes stop_codon:yes gene_type:complete